MEVRKPKIKSVPYEEWKDNSSLEKLVDELHEGGVNVVTGSLDQLINWGRSNSLWSLTFATSCCGIEFMWLCPLRLCSLWFRGDEKLTSSGRLNHVCRYHYTQDGTRAQASIRRDGRTQIRHCRGRLCHQWRSVQIELPRSKRY